MTTYKFSNTIYIEAYSIDHAELEFEKLKDQFFDNAVMKIMPVKPHGVEIHSIIRKSNQ